MSKADKEHMIRLEGMEYALSVAKKVGVEGLESEIRRRSKSKVPLSIDNAQLAEFSNKVKSNTFKNCWVLMMVTLRDEFGFGTERISRASKRFWQKADCIEGDYTTWDEQVEILAAECGMSVELGREDLSVKIEPQIKRVSAKEFGITVK